MHYVFSAPMVILPRSPLPEQLLSAEAAVPLRFGWVLGLDRAEYSYAQLHQKVHAL